MVRLSTGRLIMTSTKNLGLKTNKDKNIQSNLYLES